MTLVDAETGEIIAACTPDEARKLTDDIKGAAERVWSLLLEAHERKAWSALGYATWADYVGAEFDMSRGHAYRLIDQARVIREIEQVVSPYGDTTVSLPEATARDIKPHLASVTEGIKKKLAEEATAPAPDRVQEIVAEVITEERDKAKARAEDREAMRDLAAAAKAAGVDDDEDRVRQRGEFSRLCRDLSNLPEPAAFIGRQREFLTERHIAQAERAYAWLDSFLLDIRESAA